MAFEAAPRRQLVRQAGVVTGDRYGLAAAAPGQRQLHQHVAAAVEPERPELDDGQAGGHVG
jgi:hypothetical protein